MKTLILYGTTTGNTQTAATQIQQKLTEQGKSVELKNVTELGADQLGNYDLLIAGASTWDDGLLQEDFRNFAQQLKTQQIDLAGKKVAIFGLGESTYPQFCQAAELLAQLFNQLGAQQVGSTLKIDGFPDEAENQQKIASWIQELNSAWN